MPASGVGAGVTVLRVFPGEVWAEDEQLTVVLPVVCESSGMLTSHEEASPGTHASQAGAGGKWRPHMVLL